MWLLRLSLLALVLGASAAGHAATAPIRPVPGISRALLVSIDGLRPDVLLRAKAPVLRRLIERGCFTMWARTTAVAVTLPSHASMLTGVTPARHRLEWNSVLPLAHPIYPAVPTLFELARKGGLTTAMVAGKSKFSALATPGTLNWSFVPVQSVIPDEAVADTATTWIRRYAPQVLFVHLPEVDTAGHAEGWGSAAQLRAVTAADGCIGRILEALRARRVLDSTLVLVTSDHGGAGRSHGADDTRSRTIPWIIVGPGIRPGVDLTSDANLEIRTEDTFATICFLLGIPVPDGIDGRAVDEILSGDRSTR